MMKRLEDKPYVERLRELCVFSMEQRQRHDSCFQLFLLTTEGRIPGNGFKLHPSKFSSHVSESFLTIRRDCPGKLQNLPH